ncbi:MAG: S9 family peptidase [Muribaculaceae bacterium]|nr:S9 family peptidase [Muribaculaceae bacterium]
MKPIKTIAIMLSTVALLTSSTCSDIVEQQAPIIGKPDVKVENGQFTPELLNSLGRVSGPTVSPDGKKILYGVTYQDIEQNKGNRELWVMDVDGQNATQITKTPSSENNAVWIDGGRRIAFVYKEGDATQLWVMNADGSDRKCVSDLENGVDGFVLSPDEKHVVLISQVKYGKNAQDHHPDLKKANARIIDDLMYKHWDEWVETIPHPFVADFDGSQVTNVKDVLDGEPFESPMKPWGDVESLAWTPDSKSLIYVCRKKVGKEYAISTNSDLFRYELATGKTENLTEGMMGYDTYPIVSKSGRLAWLSMEHDGYEADKNRIFLMDTNGEKKDLTANWDYSVDAIAWSPDEQFIYFICPFQGTQPIFRMEVATQKVDTIASGTFDYDGLAFAGNDTLVTMRHNYATPNEVFSVKVGEEPKQLSHVNDDLLAQLDSITIERRIVRTTDGKDMVTWVVLPPKFDPQKKYPAILFCEGGPQSPVSQFWSYRWNFRIMAANGYVVIAPNRRGLPGFGTEWNAQISGDYGGQNMKDYMSAVDDMKREPYIDGDHIGAVGASYGGYSVYWLAGNHQNRFACFLAHAGIFNLEAQYLETEEMWFVNWDLGGPFWEKNATTMKSYTVANPKNYVQNWNRPIMVTAGEKDYRIVFTQATQAFNAAKLMGLDARMVLFPEENHWILKPQNSILWQREFFGWLDRWLKPQAIPTTEEAAPADSVK